MENVDWQNLTRAERRRLKREQKKLEKVRERSAFPWQKAGILLVALFFLAGGGLLWGFINQKRYENAPKMQITPLIYDFGQISEAAGAKETTMEVKNIGAANLVVTGMITSCNCTTAKLTIGDNQSPIFGMHQESTGWKGTIPSGQTGQLTVIYDPKAMPVRGPITRIVTIFSNDPGGSQEATIYANVSP